MNNDAALTPTEPIPPRPPSALRKIFIGKDGLRAGWSLLIFIALFAAIMFSLNVIGHKLHPPAKTAKTASVTTLGFHFFIGEAIAQNKLVGNFTLAVSRSDLELTRRVLDIVDWHLQLIERNGYEFLRVVKPIRTEIFAVDADVTDGTPKLKLTPMA